MRCAQSLRGYNLLAALTAALLIGCAAPAAAPFDEEITDEPAVEPAAQASPAPTRTPRPSATARTTEVPESSATPPAIEETAMPANARSPQARFAVADLAARLNISPDQIEVVSEQEVTWSDGSLGCPQPDMMYTQALVNGMQIFLRAGGRVYDYHSGGNADPFLCAGSGGLLIDPNVTPKGGDEHIPPPGLPDS